MARNCNCSGGCGPQDNSADGVTRREFITLVGAGTAGLLLNMASATQAAPAPPISAQTPALQAPADELARWTRALREPSAPRVYNSATHTDARMHLGGIGTGNFEIGVDGQCTTWQLFNTLRDGNVPFHFAARVGNVTKLLQTTGGPDWPRVRQIEMTGEYPLATLRYLDPDLPVQLEMTAFTPFAPLDARLSSMPVAAFVFRIHNPTPQAQSVKLIAMMQNPVGYDATGPNDGLQHPNFGGNTNSLERDGKLTMLAMSAVTGQEPTLDKPLQIFTNLKLDDLLAQPVDRPQTLTVENLDRLAATPAAEASQRIIWLENAPTDLPEPTLRAARDAVRAGATLVFSGSAMPLIAAYGQATEGKPLGQANTRPDIVFEDFETDYAKWKVEGTAFGNAPFAGTQPNQQPVSGFMGKRLVNSYLGTDDVTGRLTSQPFTIERDYIRFLVGGGSHPTTQIRLMINGQVVRATSGHDREQLEPAVWDVREFKGQQAQIAIVDEQTGPWGHINVDQIEFTDQAGSRALMELLEELMPARFSGLEAPGNAPITFQNWTPLPGSQKTAGRNGLRLTSRAVGQGRVFLAAGPILNAGDAPYSPLRQRAYAQLSAIVGAHYTPATGTLPTAPGFGTLALATQGEHPIGMSSFQHWEEAQTFLEGGFRDRKHKAPADFVNLMGTGDQATESKSGTLEMSSGVGSGHTLYGALGNSLEVPAGQTMEVPFFLAWHYPNKYSGGQHVSNHYTTLWPDAHAVAREAATNFPDLRARTEQFRNTFYDSTLPYWMLDCITSQAATIRHIGVTFRIGNGDIYGWEGSNGCCDPTCTHVWGYEQSLSRLFPDLEREMRRIDYKHQQGPDGGINNRTAVPSPTHPSGEHPFTDGHASCVLKAYREALNAPDDSWLREYWPNIQHAVEYLIQRDAATSGGTPDGILKDDQWNTYDEALHGVTTFISTYYLAALRAGEELAKRQGDVTAAARYHAIFEKGQKRLVDLCWNGEYFQQNLADYDKRGGEIGPGCMADQLIGQWWAHQLGLGYILPPDLVRTALRNVFKYNFLTDHTHWQHNWRKFAGGKDKGLLITTWPKGGRPANPMLYVDEVWTGIEYQVASHMIYEGLIDEAFAVIKGARDRYDGIPRAPISRNPWNEIECGGHYARAMSSWSILLAMSGYQYDGISHALRFAPRHTPDNFKSFFTGPESWGSLSQTRPTTQRAVAQRNEITVVEGNLAIASLHLATRGKVKQARAQIGGKPVASKFETTPEGVVMTFTPPVVARHGGPLSVELV